MQISVELPEDIALAITANGESLTRAAEEGLALEGYRSGKLSEEQVRRLLKLESSLEVHGFLKAHQVYLNYTEADLEHDLEAARRFSQYCS